MPKVLVTGGLGYIGSHTITCLVESGYDVVIVDNLSNSDIKILGRLEAITGRSLTFYQVDLCDKLALESIFEIHNDIIGVIHFAAWLQVHESVEEPTKYYFNNLVSTLHLIDACVRYEVKNVVFSSSCTVYGQPDVIPVDEQAPLKRAESPYGNTKVVGEQMFEDAVRAYGLKVMNLRYFNPIGAHSSAKIGEVQQGEPHHLVPYITETAIGKRDYIRVFGGDYDTRDGTCVRDYIHVMDIAEAHMLALNYLIKMEGSSCDYLNLGSGEGQTVLEMIQTFEKVTGLEIKHQIVARRPGDVEKVYAKIAKAKQVLNWEPKRSLSEMLLSAWKWEQAQLAD